MSEEQIACCQACFENRLGRSYSVEYDMRNSIYSYDCPSNILIKSTMFFCNGCWVSSNSGVVSDD